MGKKSSVNSEDTDQSAHLMQKWTGSLFHTAIKVDRFSVKGSNSAIFNFVSLFNGNHLLMEELAHLQQVL